MIGATLLVAAVLALSAGGQAPEPGATTPADDLTTARRTMLGADLQAEYRWTLTAVDERAERRAESHPALNAMHRVWHAPLARGRSAFKIEFTRPYVEENTVFHLYVNADDDLDTGRKDAGHRGTDFMFTVSGGVARLSVFRADGSSTGGVARMALDDNVLYLSADIPLKQENGRSVFECWVTSYVRGEDGGQEVGTRIARTRVVTEAEPDLDAEEFAHVAMIDTTDLAMDSVRAQVFHPDAGDGPLRARITWRTNWITPGTVEYGPTEDLGHSASTPFSSRNHRIILSDLQPDTTYHFRVLNLALTGERMASETLTFSTNAPDLPAPGVARAEAPLRIINRAEAPLRAWPVRAGIPFARGEIFTTESIRLLDAGGEPRPCAFTVMSRWPDGSLRWALAQFRADAPGATETAYRVEYGTEVSPPPGASPLRVEETSQEIRVDTGRLRFSVTRAPFAAFSGVQVRAEDGTWQSTEAGEMTLVTEDTAGVSYHAAGGLRELEVERLTAEAVVIRAVGDHVAADGDTLLEWTLRLHAYPDSALVRVFHTFGVNDLDAEFTEFRRVALRWRTGAAAGAPAMLGGDDAVELRVPAEGAVRLFQHLDDAYALELPEGAQEGRRAAGWVSAGEGAGALTVAMRDFWEHYPKSIQVAPGVVELDIAPLLAADQYDAFPELEHVLFAPLRGGVYRFRRGLEKRHEMAVQFGPRDDEALEAVRTPPVVAAPPERFRDTEALGRIAIAADLPPRYSAYTEAVRTGLDGYLAERDRDRLYGFMHFGDWHGERRYNWGNMEYDTPHAFLMEFAASGDAAFFVEGQHAARHYMDIDVVHHDRDPRRVGLVWVHAMLHTGGYYERDDPRFEIAYPHGHAENWGHKWGEGLADYYWLTGDPRARRVLLNIADMAASLYLDTRGHLQPGTGWIIARHPGWMSKILMAGYAVSGDEYYLNAARTILEYWVDYQTPNGGWDRRLGGGHCPCDPPHYGEAGFMVSVLMAAMKRYHELTGDERVGRSIVAGARWMIEDLWMPEDRGFRYTSCPTMTRGGGAVHMLEPVAYAHRLEPDALFRDVALQFADARLTRVSPAGKGISAHIRAVPHTLADLLDMTEGPYYALGGPGPHTVLLKETQDRAFTVRVQAWLDGDPEGRVEGSVTLEGPDGEEIARRALSGEGRIEEVIEVAADEQAGIHTLTLEAGGPDILWEVHSDLHREVVEVGERTELGAGVAYPRYRFHVWPETSRIVLQVRAGRPGERTVAVLDPNGEQHATHVWQEAGDGTWQRVEVEVPPFEPVTVGFGYRDALNDSDRQWSVSGDGAPLAVQFEGGAARHVSASSLAHFVPERPRAFIGGRTVLRPGEPPTVRLDGSASQALEGRIVAYEWDMGDGTRLTGPQVEHTYRRDGQFEAALTVTDERGRSHTETVTLRVPPPELAQAAEGRLIMVRAAEFTAQEGGEVMVTDRIGADGPIITGWEGTPGHTLTWEVEVEQAGRYALGLRFASARHGTTRQFMVNGEQPYPEMQEVAFPFTGGWSRTEDNWEYALLRNADGEPLVFDLEAGTHVISGADRTGGLAVDFLMLVRQD